jgi:hypothetical protein
MKNIFKHLRQKRRFLKSEPITRTEMMYDEEGNELGEATYTLFDLTSYVLEGVSKEQLDKWYKIYDKKVKGR